MHEDASEQEVIGFEATIQRGLGPARVRWYVVKAEHREMISVPKDAIGEVAPKSWLSTSFDRD
jgi:hypothetical protein